MLTQKQHDLLIFLDKTFKETGVCPSFDEMKDYLGLKSIEDLPKLEVPNEEVRDDIDLYDSKYKEEN